MHDLRPHLKQEYDRSVNDLGECPYDIITPLQVLKAHFLILDHFLDEDDSSSVTGKIRHDLLESAVSRPCASYQRQSKWKGTCERVATLFYGLVNNHAFTDGNKRTALLILLFDLYQRNRIVQCKERMLEELAVRTAANELQKYSQFDVRLATKGSRADANVACIAEFLKKHTRKEDKRRPIMTFRELRKLLRAYDFDLENPSGNYVNVVKREEKKTLFGSVKEVTKVITKIGYPRESAEVSLKDLKAVRRATELTHAKGYDFAVLMGDEAPLSALLSKFEEPLRRLKDS